VVSLLFADLAGYTRLCESRDPEQVHLLVRPAMNALRALCEDRGGVVPGIQGDGFMAVFGARVAREDDPSRALEAAVGLQRAVQARRGVLPDLPELRVGLHVGEVLVASSWEATGISVAGDAVNVAARVCGAAEPGQVLVTREAMGVVRTDAGWGDEAHLQLRGRDAPVTVRPFDWRSAPDLLRGARWSAVSPYVDRPELERRLEAAVDSGGAVLVGDAGMGKTRLVEHVLRGRPVLRASASSALRPSAADVCADLLEQMEHPPAALLALLRGGSSDGLAEEGMLLRSAGAQIQGAVVVVDDAEVLEDHEVTLLGKAVSASTSPWVVASRRPLPGLALDQVEVPAWRPDEAQMLLDQTLPRASAELRHAILRRAGDCPLYVEQCVRLLLDNGAVAVDGHGTHIRDGRLLHEIPSSMRLFVSSRLDLLPPAERSVLATAAVLGAVPELALLEHLAGEEAELVEPLVERGFLRWVEGPGAQPQLQFAHALVRDVAYESELRSRRVEIHRAAAQWYAVLPVAQVLESQAYHLEAAVNLEEPDCDLLRRTVEAMVLYARSIEQERTRVSRDVVQRARTLADRRPECPVDRLGLELAWTAVCELGGDVPEAGAAAGRALAMAEERADLAAAAEAHLQLARALRFRDPQEAHEHLDQAAELYERVTDRAGVARAEIERGIAAGRSAGLASYLGHLEQAYQLAMRSADVRLQASCAQLLAMHHAIVSGRPGYEVWAELARSVSRSDDVGLEPRLDVATAVLADLGLVPEGGLEAALRALAAGRDLALEHVYTNALVAIVSLLLLAGRLDEGHELLREAREHATSRGASWLHLQLDLLEARLLQRGGRPGDAAALLEGVAAHDLADREVLRRDLAEARAWVALERGRFGEARALAVEAVAIDQEMNERCSPMRPRLVELVATVAAGDAPSLGTIATLRAEARETGLTTIAQLASRWLYVDELTRGWSVDLHGLEELDVVECRALDLEIGAFSSGLWDMLRDAAAVWAELGTTVWQARALLWHSELTGTPSPEADEILRSLDAPEDLAGQFRAQVRGLR
jgi:class 3 adenylate cyclase